MRKLMNTIQGLTPKCRGKLLLCPSNVKKETFVDIPNDGLLKSNLKTL